MMGHDCQLSCFAECILFEDLTLHCGHNYVHFTHFKAFTEQLIEKLVMIAIFVFVFQSLDPLPMQGPELGVQADDIEAPETERETKQEVLENKDVRLK